MMTASNKQESIPKATVVFIHFLIHQDERTCMNSNKLNMVKCDYFIVTADTDYFIDGGVNYY